MDQSLIDLGVSMYDRAVGNDDVERDAEGFIILKPRADHVDKKLATLTTSIDTLEDKLKELRASQAAAKAYTETEEYREEKKAKKKGKKKKDRERLINMVFNNADKVAEMREVDGGGDDSSSDSDSNVDKKGRKSGSKKSSTPATTLDTTYGQRFSPIVSMLHDSIEDFGRIAAEIEEELNSPACRGKTMYRSTQTGNMITAKNSQLSALRELGSIAKTLSDLEYKKDKEKQAEEKDTTKALSNLAAKYLKTTDEVGGKKKKGKESRKEKSKSSFEKASKDIKMVDDDDDDEVDRKDSGKAKRNYELAQEFAKVLEKRADEISFSPYEQHLDMEGRYKFMVVCDPLDPDHNWDFVPVDPVTNKEIKGFRKEYKDLMPKKKACRMRFDIQKMKCTDLNSSKSYRLVFSSD